MAQVSLTLNAISSGLIDISKPNQNIRPQSYPGLGYSYNISYDSAAGEFKRLYFSFPSFPEAYKYNRLYNVLMTFACILRVSQTNGIYLYSVNGNFDPETVTYNTRVNGDLISSTPSKITGTGYTQTLTAPSLIAPYNTDTYKSEITKKILKGNGVYIQDAYSGSSSFDFFDEEYRLSPSCIIYYDDAEIVTSTVIGNGKTSGYINPHIVQEIGWSFVPDGDYYCAADWEQTSAVFHWRNGTSGAWNDISASGANQSVTIAANTFSVGTLQWYVTATDDYGTTTDSTVYTVTTADSSMAATAISPIGTVEDGSAAIEFSWSASNDNGNAPTGADLQYSTDMATWADMASISGAVTTYSAPANTLPGGILYWRVRAYNVDNVAGDWSEAVSFISVSAPAAPIVSVIPVPFAVISWQSVGQQAYKITIDGVSYGPFFGTAKEYRLKDYLEDGEHTASVEIQGVYGLWSQPGSVTFTVANAPGDGITLTGSFDRDAALSWTTASATADFLVYRDDKQIAATSVTGYSDRFVLGAHSYQVINRLANGNYTASNVVNGVMRSCTTAIAPFNGGAWQELKLSENSYSEQRFSWAKLSSTRHVTGAVYPVIEVSEYEDAAGSYDVSFPDVESANAFLALRGQIVILKSRGGNVVIGALTQIEQANKDFYISFAFTIQRIDWEDYVDAQNS